MSNPGAPVSKASDVYRSLEKSSVQSAIQKARELVAGEEEPWRSLAFQVILSRIISENKQSQEHDASDPNSKHHSERGERAAMADHASEELLAEEVGAAISIPGQSLERILALKEREQIPILWSLASKPTMSVDEFLAASSRAGVTIAPSYSPTKGGNFRNRLVKQDKMFIEDGKVGKVPRYKLSAAGKLKSQKFFASSG
jgi:hypothetical protein